MWFHSVLRAPGVYQICFDSTSLLLRHGVDSWFWDRERSGWWELKTGGSSNTSNIINVARQLDHIISSQAVLRLAPKEPSPPGSVRLQWQSESTLERPDLSLDHITMCQSLPHHEKASRIR